MSPVGGCPSARPRPQAWPRPLGRGLVVPERQLSCGWNEAHHPSPSPGSRSSPACHIAFLTGACRRQDSILCKSHDQPAQGYFQKHLTVRP